MRLFFLVFSFALFINDARAGGKVIDFFPGKSLGLVEIGGTLSSLKKLGFEFDDSRASNDPSISYMKKDNFLARLINDKVVQIWHNAHDLTMLRFNGKKLPADSSPASFKKFFQGCEELQGSGGKLLYCEHRGIELDFPRAKGPVGFSVILPSEVEKIIANSSKN
jgi:hypothetical protein